MIFLRWSKNTSKKGHGLPVDFQTESSGSADCQLYVCISSSSQKMEILNGDLLSPGPDLPPVAGAAAASSTSSRTALSFTSGRRWHGPPPSSLFWFPSARSCLAGRAALFCAACLAASGSSYKTGDFVWYFHEEERGIENARETFVALEDHAHGNYRPRLGLSEGWLPGQVVGVFPPAEQCSDAANKASPPAQRCSAEGPNGEEDTYYSVRTSWTLWASASGVFCCGPDDEPSRHLYRNVTSRYLKDKERPMRPNSFVPETQPELSIIALRWWGPKSSDKLDPETMPSQKPRFLHTLVDRGVKSLVGLNYEVWSVYLGYDDDAENLAKLVQHVFSEQHSARRAKHVVTSWHVLPFSFDMGSAAALLTGDGHWDGNGMLDKDAVLNLVRGFERAGIYTMFPGSARLWEVLVSKIWTHMLCLDTKFRIPPTIALPRSLARHMDAGYGARLALQSLEKVKKQQFLERGLCAAGGAAGTTTTSQKNPSDGVLGGDHGAVDELGAAPTTISCSPPPVSRGAAKLGFSWSGLHVKLWNERGRYKLSDALSSLSDTIQIRGQYVGQSHTMDHIMVQEFVPHIVVTK